MNFSPLKIAGAWLHTPTVFPDARGSFHEVFRASELEAALGRTFSVLQVNQSVSKKGVLRGIHWTDSDEGQAKYVSCPRGAIWDFVVDLRPESPTYGQWDAVMLSDKNNLAVFVSERLGHGFLALEEGSITRYLCSTEFIPDQDRSINPHDPTIGIRFEEIAPQYSIKEFLLSEKDSNGVFL